MRPEDDDEEIAAVSAVKGCAKSLAMAACAMWHWGDGYGGWVMQQITDAFEEAGLPIVERGPVRRKADIPVAIKLRVVARDGCRCRHCGVDLMDGEVTFDHVIPESKGGPTTIGNLVVSCRPCNCSKGTK